MTYGSARAQARFLDEAVITASPARLVVMLYDRLLLDLARAVEAQTLGDRGEASRHLLHAQDIVLELTGSLQHGVWEGSAGLASLYGFIHSELVRANVSGDPARTLGVSELVAPLAEAWRIAAVESIAVAVPGERVG
jgi:flagellar protein FliS